MTQEEESSNAKSLWQRLGTRFFGGDRVLWIIIAILSIASLLVIYSSTASMAYRKAGGDTAHYFLQQFKFIILGFAAMIFVHRFDYQRYARPRLLSLVFGVALCFTLLTFFVGVNFNDASRWLRIPILGVTFQPSDFLRIALIGILARQLARRQKGIERMPLLPSLSVAAWQQNPDKHFNIFLHNTLPILGPIAVACGVIFFSNFSTAAITFVTCCIMLYMGRVRVREILRVVTLVTLVMVVVVTVMCIFDIGRSRTWASRVGIKLTDNTEQVEQRS
ncbi:MAG: FtsW/RodA/SpoVE family cell cycle protein, partial [Alistipes sp.]|nr:FtsW/RodA/SpoVE family cell cycle protein [Alistipes sp.]